MARLCRLLVVAVLMIQATYAVGASKEQSTASTASATPDAAVRGKSSAIPKAQSVRGRRHAAAPNGAGTVSQAETVPEATGLAPPSPQVIDMSLVLTNLGKLDMGTGSFTAQFYLAMRSDHPIPASTELYNGTGSFDLLEELPKSDEQPFYERSYRLLANLTSPIDLKHYPFDQQQLQIIIEDKLLTDKKLVYTTDPRKNTIDNYIWFPGWDIQTVTADIKKHAYPTFNESYSQYVFSIDIHRIRLSAFIKTFLPVIFIMLVVLSSFILGLSLVTTRLTMVSSGLVASVMFHVSIQGQIPPVGYLTFADKYMLLTYFILLVCFAINAVILVLQGKKKEHVAQKLHTSTEYSMFGVVPTLYGVLFWVCV